MRHWRHRKIFNDDDRVFIIIIGIPLLGLYALLLKAIYTSTSLSETWQTILAFIGLVVMVVLMAWIYLKYKNKKKSKGRDRDE